MTLFMRDAPVILQPPSTLPAPVPFAFGPRERPLCGWYHAPRIGTDRAAAVVLCKPMGYEALCTHASYRHLAERLSESGYPVLRFDYDGTGDSFGADEDEDRVRAWIASIGFAIDTLRERSGKAEIVLFGLRLGATLATLSAAKRGDVRRLILWAPFRDGRSYLREMRALHAAHRQSQVTPQPPARAGGYEEAAGFLFTCPTLGDLVDLDVAAIDRTPAANALLIGRDDLPTDMRLAARLAALGTVVTEGDWPGYAAMMRDAQDSAVPLSAIASIIDWLDANDASAPAGPAVLVRSTAAAESLVEADTYREEPIFYGGDPGSFGILTLPRTHPRCDSTAILLLTVGANPHIGPNRMYVTLGRELATSGFPVFRLDIPGVGDSARGAASARHLIYSPAAIADVQAAIEHLTARIGAERFVLVGLCSGAYLAYQLTVRDPRVAGQILINPRTFEWKEGDTLEKRGRQSYKSTRFYLDATLKTETWARALRGGVNVKGITGILRRRWGERATMMLQSVLAFGRTQTPYESDVCRMFRMIAERGTDTFFIFSAVDAGLDMMESHLGARARKMRARKNFRVEVIDGADHTFTQKDARERMLASIVQHLSRLYA